MLKALLFLDNEGKANIMSSRKKKKRKDSDGDADLK